MEVILSYSSYLRPSKQRAIYRKKTADREYHYAIQAVLVDAREYAYSRALEMVIKNGWRPIKPAHLTDRYWRFRMIPPDDPRWIRDSFRTYPHLWLPGVKLIIGRFWR